MRVAVPPECLNARVGGLIPRFCRHVLSNGAFGIQRSLSGVNAFGSFFDIGARSFPPRHIRNDQLVRIALLFRQQATCLNALCRIRNRAVKRGPSCAQTECRDHQPRVAEHCLCLQESLPRNTANKAIRAHVNIVERLVFFLPEECHLFPVGR